MLSANNILKPQDGKARRQPHRRTWFWACYYLTIVREGSKGEGMVFTDVDEALMAYETGYISLQAKVKIRIEAHVPGPGVHQAGGNLHRPGDFQPGPCPQDMGAKPRNTPDDMFLLEVDEVVGKSELGKIIDMCYRAHGVTVTATMLDNLKSLGYQVLHPRRADRFRGRHHRARKQEDHSCRSRKPGAPHRAGVPPRSSFRKRAVYFRSSRSGNRPPTTLPSRLWNPWIDYNPINMMADLRRPRLRQPDSSAGRHARPDGLSFRKDHRAAHQAQTSAKA